MYDATFPSNNAFSLINELEIAHTYMYMQTGLLKYLGEEVEEYLKKKQKNFFPFL